MIELNESYAPYAPNNAVLGILRRQRDQGIPDPVNIDELVRNGVSRSSAHKTLRALEFLGLVDETGRQTPEFTRLQDADSNTYRSALADIVRKSYSPIFDLVDPSKSSDAELLSAFSRFVPAAQRERMVGLFQALGREAGLIGGRPRLRSAPYSRFVMPMYREEETEFRQDFPVTNEAETTDSLASWTSARDFLHHNGQSPSWPKITPATAISDAYQWLSSTTQYLLLEALLRQLPSDGKWSPERRQRWLRAVEGAVDLLVDIEDEHDSDAGSTEKIEENSMP